MKVMPLMLFAGGLFFAFTGSTAPRILTEPLSQAANPSSNVTFAAVGSGIPPLRFQWFGNGAALIGKTNPVCVLTNLQSTDAGYYSVVVSDSSGSVTSRLARLELISGFTRIINSTLARAKNALGAAFGDFNNDGWVDLVVSGDYYLVYTNAGHGNFIQITNRILGGDTNFARTGTAWADYDNDGHLDLAIGGWGARPLGLYHNRGDGQFTRITTNIFDGPGVQQLSVAWGDYDNDGFVDMFVPTAIAGTGPYPDMLFHNNGNGTFARISNSPLVTDPTANQGALWGDFDDDGDLDLFVTSVTGGKNRLYRNQGGGAFVALTNSPVMQDGGQSGGCVWGDFDNDSDLDLFVSNFQGNALYYVNDGTGGFTRVTNSIIVQDGPSAGCIPLDFDNDGWLDLVSPGAANLLYHNAGDGTFTKVTTGPIVTQPVTSFGNNSFAAADVDRDGFQDLLWVDFNGNSQLFHNDGNSNAWLAIRCEGRLSNRAGIGTKVRLGAWISGTYITQLREIGGGGLVFTQNEPVAAFGVGSAVNVAHVTVEWPSGVVQQFSNVSPFQFLHVIEPIVRIAPAHTNVPAGSTATFALSEPVDSVQWYYEDTALPGQTNATLTIANVREANLGRYTAYVVDSVSGATVVPVAATLAGPVIVSDSFKTNYVRFGSNITFNATAVGAFPLTYQWFQNESAIVDATNSSFVLANATIDDEGAYSVTVSNSYGEVRTQQGSVVVLVRPSIIIQPLDQQVVSNAAVSFSISASGHPMPLGFRWRRNAVTYTNISIFGSNCFVTFPALRPDGSNSITFSVAVTNLAGSILSSNAVVTFASDADLDGLPDDWEISHGFQPSDSADALRDDDHDGTSNLAEYQSGTDPRDPNNVLQLDLLSIGDAQWNATFLAQSNRTYTVQAAENVGQPWRPLLNVPATATNRTIQVTGGFDNRSAIFRIKTPASP
jgi:enediyne biosynthesis protein E4